MTYQPVQGYLWPDQFTFKAELAATVDIATVTVVVIQGDCLVDKRFCDDGR